MVDCLIFRVSLILLQWMGVSSHHQSHQAIAIHRISSVCFSLSLCLSLSPASLLLDRWYNTITLHLIKPSIHCSFSDIITPGHYEKERIYVLLTIALIRPDVHLLVWTGFLWHTVAEGIPNLPPVSGLFLWYACDPCHPAETDQIQFWTT